MNRIVVSKRAKSRLLYLHTFLLFSITSYFLYASVTSSSDSSNFESPGNRNLFEDFASQSEYDIVEAEVFLHEHGVPPPATQTKLIILSYMRSGSTFFGHLLSQIEGSFYIYEPYRLIQRYMEDNGRKSYKTLKKPDFFTLQKEWTEKILNCNFKETIFNKTFVESFKRQNIIEEYAEVIRKSSFRSSWDKYRDNPALIEKEEQLCKNTSFLILKSIRVTYLELVWETFKRSEGVKFVHLLRDPRAIQYSRLNLKRNSGPRWVCDWPARNLEFLEKQSEKDDLLFTYYYEFVFEDFAKYPIAKIRHFFEKFLLIKLPSRVTDLIVELTQRESNRKSKFGIESRNIERVADKWKTELSFEDRIAIEDSPSCQKVLNYVGYKWPLVSYVVETKHIS